jgi:16S rRNA (cytosine1402-N4)-methyltransferase
MATNLYHQPAMVKEVLSYLITNPKGIYVDVTFGGGGHSKAILNHLAPEGILFAFDQDPYVPSQEIVDPRFHFFPHSFHLLRECLSQQNVKEVDGILADLGISSHQIDTPERGFSYRFPDSPLDMRMNPHEQQLTATMFLQTAPVSQIAHVLSIYGEIKHASAIAHAIASYRQKQPIRRVKHLLEAVQPFIPKTHPYSFLSKLFQALRIHINDELKRLEILLQEGTSFLKPGGRFVILTYHSLEDRRVKSYFRYGNFSGKSVKNFYGVPLPTPLTPLTKKPITPSSAEIQRNPRIRSAKLRAAQKNPEPYDQHPKETL